MFKIDWHGFCINMCAYVVSVIGVVKGNKGNKGKTTYMNVLFYGPKNDKSTQELCKVVFKRIPKNKTEKCSTLADLTRRLRQPQNDIGIALLTARTKQDLEDLVALRELLSDIRVILILPDRDHDTISKAHALYPRFLSYIDRDFDEVKAVLSKMLFSLNLNKNRRYFSATN